MVRLEKVNHKNIRKILDLRVREDQRNFVAENAQSIAEAYLTLEAGGSVLPYGIFEGDTPVGFLMIGYGVDETYEDAPAIAYNNYSVWRLMIDREQQGKGYGREALALALELVKTKPCGEAEYCFLSYEPENKVAEALYRSFGFKETGEWDGDELIAALRI